jgi:predicted aconitase
MDREQYDGLCEALNEILSKLQWIETKIEVATERNPTMQQLRRFREQRLDEYRRTYQRQHGVMETNPSGEDVIG